ncbi:MAG: indolepyruvate ferredoxin oxidoreductase subunit alpha [Gammaproteobacteria bacterium]|nr:indolepyruvate ferredoxin oxidoreductase subunit alpha [Gammaproteobacteria bacterium]
MAERSFKNEIEKLRLGEGDEFSGEGILAVTKALLQAGVAYIGGYQGSPISHLIDVFNDAQDLLGEMGIHFESSANEATAAAMLAASINYPLRGAVAWKSTVGTNVASDALANIASAGVRGGVLIIVGEDYGEGSSIMQERTHAFAMKSQMWLLDPRPNLQCITDMAENGFELSEASHTPVMMQMRVRACHVYGTFKAKSNRRPAFTVSDALDAPTRQLDRIILPPFNYEHEAEKVHARWPAAVQFIESRHLNEFIVGEADDIGIIVTGGLYNNLNRALELTGCADVFGNTRLPIYVMNVVYPVVDNEVIGFCRGKRAVLIVEEGQPDYLEQNINTILRRNDVQTRIAGKDVLSLSGEYTVRVIEKGVRAFLAAWAPQLSAEVGRSSPGADGGDAVAQQLADAIPVRPSGLCTGCPERPFFSAMKLLEREVGPLQASMDIGCHSFATLDPFNIGNTITGYGLGPASASALMIPHRKRALSVMGDGGFWHNGLTTGVGNAVENQHDGVIVIVDNGYSAATGGQWIPSSRAEAEQRRYRIPLADVVRAVGVRWVKQVRTYDIRRSLQALRQAMTTRTKGPKVIIADGECQLNRQRRIKPQIRARIDAGKRHVRERFGVDPETCTGDHSCIRLSGCPSLTIKDNPDPLRSDPVAHVVDSCVGCGVCGEVAHAAVLCPSFYRADILFNPTAWDRVLHQVRTRIITSLRRGFERPRARESGQSP